MLRTAMQIFMKKSNVVIITSSPRRYELVYTRDNTVLCEIYFDQRSILIMTFEVFSRELVLR